MKRLLSGILICICILGMATGVHAENTIVPLWDNINRLTVNITFDGTAGKASAYVSDATYSAEISGTLTVYKQTKAGWLFICREKGTSSSGALPLKTSFTGESSAYYKAEYSVTVTKNGVSESATETAYKTCP